MDWVKANKVYLAGGVFIIIAVVYFMLREELAPKDLFENDEAWLGNEQQLLSEPTEQNEVEEKIIMIDVKGAVETPGVYEAKATDRVIDLINKAGGLQENADEAKINFALRVEDEMVVYVPAIGEESLGDEESFANGTASDRQGKDDGKININTANEAELQTLSGIGPAKAATIIEFREANGPFKSIDDIKLIGGIGEKTFEKLQDSIKVK